MWLIIALIGFAVSAVVNVLDKFVLDKTIKSPVVFVFYSTIFAILFFLLIPWAGGLSRPFDYVVVVMAGVGFVAGLWASYVGIQKSEVSHIGPFIGAVIPVFTFVWSRMFFAEEFSTRQIIALVFLILGSLVISAEKSAKHNGFHIGLAWGLLGGFLYSIFGASAKYLYANNDFISGFVWSQTAVGVAALILLFFPAVWRSFKRSPVPEERFGAKKIALVAGDKFLGVVGLILVQFAVSLGSVTLVYALAGVQYVILIIIVALLSRFRSKFCHEEYSRGELVQELAAIILIATGLALLV